VQPIIDLIDPLGETVLSGELAGCLHGAVPFLVTPFDDALNLDESRLRRLVETMVDVGFAALVVTGGVGELDLLNPAERDRVWSTAVSAAEGNVAVLAGFGGQAPVPSPDLQTEARRAEDAGVDGLLLFPPRSIAMDPEGLASLVSEVTSVVSIGLVLDHGAVPSSPLATGNAARTPGVIGVKYSGADPREWELLRSSCDGLPHLAWLAGGGDCLAPQFVALGATAFTSSMANVAPGLVKYLATCLSDGDMRGAQDAVHSMGPMAALRARAGGTESLALLKAAMALQGAPVGGVRTPNSGAADIEVTNELLSAVERLDEGRSSSQLPCDSGSPLSTTTRDAAGH
jgi:4-hydroxy-tetrahydrodipicolinate synthase